MQEQVKIQEEIDLSYVHSIKERKFLISPEEIKEVILEEVKFEAKF